MRPTRRRRRPIRSLPPSRYPAGGSLRLKGGVVLGGAPDKGRRRKKGKRGSRGEKGEEGREEEGSKPEPVDAAGPGPASTGRGGGPAAPGTDGPSGAAEGEAAEAAAAAAGAAPSALRAPTPPDDRTEAEKVRDARALERHAADLARGRGGETHAERVRRFNEHLARLSEHHDMPKTDGSW